MKNLGDVFRLSQAAAVKRRLMLAADFMYKTCEGV